MVTHHRYAEVGGRTLFYREAGPVDAPVVVLLHGYPTSSFMFRELIPRLADRYRVIAPDMLGFGLSDAPPVEEFTYTFDAVADLTGRLLDALGVRRFAIYVQDYGAPIGWRLLLGRPGAVTAVISQNGNGHEAGFVTDFWEPIWAYARETTPENEQALRPALGIEAIRWQYTHGVPDPSVVSPDTWHHDAALLARPGNDRVQLALFADYVTNPALYPALHERLRAEQIPVLAVWGRNDEIFGPAGATALGDVAGADVRLVDGGHFLLESALDEVAGPMREFLDRHVGTVQETAGGGGVPSPTTGRVVGTT